MSWHPSDLVSDADLVSYVPTILSQFGQVSWADVRAKTLEDWLWPQLRAKGFDPERFRTRFAADAVYHGVSFTDVTSAAAGATADDLNLTTIFASGTSYLYVGSLRAFRGISVRVADSPSSTAATLSVALWRDTWAQVPVADATAKTAGQPFSGGGAITWTAPADWTPRQIDSTTAYWARLALSAVPTGAKAGQLSVIRRSLLCAPVTHRTLAMIFREALLRQDGPWDRRADWHEAEADRALERVWPAIGGEFDTVIEDDVIDTTEAAQTADEARGSTGWSYERA